MSVSSKFIASISLLLTVCACGAPEAAGWGYEGDTGPEHWADIDPAYALAKTGRSQSPIDIGVAKAERKDLSPIEVSYDATTLEIVNNGHTIEDDYHGGGHITVDGHTYTLAQFHFHSPSEHTINGEHAAVEMHLVHKDDDGKLAVIGVMIQEGATNEHLAHAFHHVPLGPGRAKTMEGVEVNATDLLPATLASFRYSGSLTTPPCSEDVNWFVLQSPIEASKEQIERFREKLYFGNNRPTQPLNGRVVTASR